MSVTFELEEPSDCPNQRLVVSGYAEDVGMVVAVLKRFYGARSSGPFSFEQETLAFDTEEHVRLAKRCFIGIPDALEPMGFESVQVVQEGLFDGLT